MGKSDDATRRGAGSGSAWVEPTEDPFWDGRMAGARFTWPGGVNEGGSDDENGRAEGYVGRLSRLNGRVR